MTDTQTPQDTVRRMAGLLTEWREHTAGRLVADLDPEWVADWQSRKDRLLADIERART